MPTHIRAQCSWQVGSMLPRDQVQITPCFRHQSLLVEGGPEWQQLADDLSAGLQSWCGGVIGNSNESVVRLYQIGGEPPNRPKATKKINTGNSSEAASMREVALCLSFNGGPNAPRNRGRLYVPRFLATSGAAIAARPDSTIREKVAELAPIFAGLGGVNVDWIVWSPTANAATKVERWFVDDEWDIQRRRGLRPTTRTAGTTGG